MKRKQASYSLEFKLQAIAMVKEGRQTAADIARSLGVPKSTLFDWVREYDEEHGEKKEAPSSRKEGEIQRLSKHRPHLPPRLTSSLPR